MLRYFRKRRNLEPIQNKDSAPPIYEVKPEQFESLAEKPTVNIIRDHKEFERPEAYEVVRPFLVFGRTEKLMDKMLPTIAALANE